MVLPIGKYSIGIQVRDSELASVASLITRCDITVASNSASHDGGSCISLENDIVVPYLNENDALMSKRSKDIYILQSLQTALLYVYNYNDNCSYELFVNAIEILWKYFGSDTADLCESEQVLVCVCGLPV